MHVTFPFIRTEIAMRLYHHDASFSALVNLCLSLSLASPSIPPNCQPALNMLLLFLSPGFLLGWLRVSDKPYSHARPGADGDWKILSSHLRGILHRKTESHSLRFSFL